MLLRRPVLDAILAGRISLVFRRWQRPTVKEGGTLKTAIGVLAIKSVDEVVRGLISVSDAKRAGFADLAALLADIDAQKPGTIHRIGVAFAGADPRVALRETTKLSADEWETLAAKLARMDVGKTGPWTRRTLGLIARKPATAAQELADELGLEKAPFKQSVRKLKELGLTESLEVGYRLSPRGKAVLRRLKTR
jgi:hypothetical protein